jgi:hypothetical protein
MEKKGGNKMISNELKELITPHLKEWIAESDYTKIPSWFEEAYLMDDKESQALAKVNAVRARAKASQLNSFADYKEKYSHSETFSLNALDVILDERARELFGENEGRWVDLRRCKQLVRYNLEFNEFVSLADMTGADGQIKWLRPIPAAEISTNTGINDEDQNPGYKSSIQ